VNLCELGVRQRVFRKALCGIWREVIKRRAPTHDVTGRDTVEIHVYGKDLTDMSLLGTCFASFARHSHSCSVAAVPRCELCASTLNAS